MLSKMYVMRRSVVALSLDESKEGCEWKQMGTNGNKWEQMGTNGNKWEQMGTNGNKWEQMGRRQTNFGSSLARDILQAERISLTKPSEKSWNSHVKQKKRKCFELLCIQWRMFNWKLVFWVGWTNWNLVSPFNFVFNFNLHQVRILLFIVGFCFSVFSSISIL
jgi:hypothetical protein